MYHRLVWSNFNLLYNFLWITLPTSRAKTCKPLVLAFCICFLFGNLRQEWPKGSLFNSYHPRCRWERYYIPWIAPYLIMLNVMQGGIKYHFLVFCMTRLGIEFRAFAYYVIIIFFTRFSYQHYLIVFYWYLSDSRSPQVTRTLLSILVGLNNAVVTIVLIHPQFSISSNLLTNVFGTVQIALAITVITITLMSNNIFVLWQGLSIYFSFRFHWF